MNYKLKILNKKLTNTDNGYETSFDFQTDYHILVELHSQEKIDNDNYLFISDSPLQNSKNNYNIKCSVIEIKTVEGFTRVLLKGENVEVCIYIKNNSEMISEFYKYTFEEFSNYVYLSIGE